MVDDGRLNELSSAQLRVLLAVVRHANGRGICWPGADRLVSLTGAARSTVIESLNRLCDLQLLERQKEGRRTLYALGIGPTDRTHQADNRSDAPDLSEVNRSDSPDKIGPIFGSNRSGFPDKEGIHKKGTIEGSAQKRSAPDAQKRKGYPTEFEQFWLAYPTRRGVKRGKQAAFKEWRKLSADDQQDAMAALENYKAALNDEFPRDACRWLRDDWQDYLEPAENDTVAALNEILQELD